MDKMNILQGRNVLLLGLYIYVLLQNNANQSLDFLKLLISSAAPIY